MAHQGEADKSPALFNLLERNRKLKQDFINRTRSAILDSELPGTLKAIVKIHQCVISKSREEPYECKRTSNNS